MNGRLVELIMRFRIELTSDATVYTISAWFHATLRVFPFENAKIGMKGIGLVRSRVNRRPIRYGTNPM